MKTKEKRKPKKEERKTKERGKKEERKTKRNTSELFSPDELSEFRSQSPQSQSRVLDVLVYHRTRRLGCTRGRRVLGGQHREQLTARAGSPVRGGPCGQFHHVGDGSELWIELILCQVFSVVQ